MSEFIIVLSFILGSLIGSFLNVLILRLPKEMDVVFDPSHCTKCSFKIPWYQNIPLFSFIFLLGKCSNCKEKISLQYPLVELLIAVSAALLAPKSINIKDILIFLFELSVLSSFVVHFVIDLRYKILPDSINIFLGILFLVLGLVKYGWVHVVFGALVGGGFPLFVTWAFYKLRGVVGLGGGDIKLFFALGMYLGFMGTIHLIFFSCFIGSVVGGLLIVIKKLNHENPIPFGPFILVVASFQIFFPALYNRLVGILF